MASLTGLQYVVTLPATDSMPHASQRPTASSAGNIALAAIACYSRPPGNIALRRLNAGNRLVFYALQLFSKQLDNLAYWGYAHGNKVHFTTKLVIVEVNAFIFLILLYQGQKRRMLLLLNCS